MKKFILKIFILFTLSIFIPIISCIMLDFFIIGNQYTEDYNASIIDKMERLKTIAEPKIVLVGNSNVAFGFRSELIEKEFNMPVVNLGLHGGLGNAFHEEMAKQAINNGDIIIICHSSYDDEGKISDCDLAWITIEKHKELWHLITTENRNAMIKTYPKYFKRCFARFIKDENNQITNCYQRNAFNIYGDNIWADTFNEKFIFKENDIWIPNINDKCTTRINKLNAHILENGATLLIAGYPIGDGEFTPDKNNFYNFEKKLKEKVNCPIISNIENYFFDYKYFYNTCLHLNSEGAVLRTEQLIKDLKNFLDKN